MTFLIPTSLQKMFSSIVCAGKEKGFCCAVCVCVCVVCVCVCVWCVCVCECVCVVCVGVCVCVYWDVATLRVSKNVTLLREKRHVYCEGT